MSTMPGGKLLQEARDVLVALMPKPGDLQIAHERGFYRVRSREMIERLHGGLEQFTHLAFYQPDSFKDQRRCIRYFAPIGEISTARRVELLPEEPNHPLAEQMYVRIGLGPVEELPRPIPSARGRRILFVPTNWTRIEAARDINDLFVGSPLEDVLYRRLRDAELLPEREYHVTVANARTGRNANYFLDMVIFGAERNLDIECDGDTWHGRRETIRTDNERDNLLNANLWHVMRFNTSQITATPDQTMGVIREAVNRYGGVVEPGDVVRHFDRNGRLGPGQGALPFGD